VECFVLDCLQFLRLLQLTDSASPIGSTAHSFGLETLAVEGDLNVAQLESFLQDYLMEVARLEATFCRLGYRLASLTERDSLLLRWLELNNRLSAFKTARESRVASATLGRRFLQLVASLEDEPLLLEVQKAAKAHRADVHYSPAFGLVGGVLDVDETATVLAYLQQSLQNLIFTFQRLLPLGQSQASAMAWRLKPTLLTIADQSEELALHPENIAVFTPLPDLASMRHPTLMTRLFVS
jgi:urease accessory protein